MNIKKIKALTELRLCYGNPELTPRPCDGWIVSLIDKVIQHELEKDIKNDD